MSAVPETVSKQKDAPLNSIQSAARSIPHHHYFEVVSGVLTGARMPLELNREYTVGATANSNIVLRGATTSTSQPPCEITIRVNDRGAQLLLPEHDQVKVLQFEEIAVFGSDQFRIVKSTSLQDELAGVSTNDSTAHSEGAVAVPDNFHQHNNTDKTSHSAESGDASASFNANNGTSRSSLLAPSNESKQQQGRRSLAGLSIAAVLAMGVIVLQLGSDHQPQNVLTVSSLQSNLSTVNFDGVSISNEDSATVVSGYVSTRQQAMDLGDILANYPFQIVNRVVSNEEIKDQISDVLRVHGVAGSVSAVGLGEFVAQTNVASEEEVLRLKEIIEQDVASLSAFDIEGAPPVPLEPPKKATAPIKHDMGKRVVLVNSDKPAYIVTEDQSRYFLGSLLPSGHRIVAIMEGRVLLERSGEKTELNF